MIGKLQCVVVDCPDVPALVAFYQALLGGEVNRPDRRWAVGDRFATLHLDSGLVIAFQHVAEYVPPQWPDPAHPQQFHLDVDVADLDQAHDRVLGLGATLLHDEPRGWRVYADPAGHPFCLLPRPSRG
jgi:catechol 2,3-dioxygenase-like lactoylglutathione lyase family enzyme